MVLYVARNPRLEDIHEHLLSTLILVVNHNEAGIEKRGFEFTNASLGNQSLSRYIANIFAYVLKKPQYLIYSDTDINKKYNPFEDGVLTAQQPRKDEYTEDYHIHPMAKNTLLVHENPYMHKNSHHLKLDIAKVHHFIRIEQTKLEEKILK